LYRLIT